VADAYAFTVLSWAALLGQSLEPYPELQHYLGRIAARPQVHAALRAEGLTPTEN
jgi:glutathione S-transferase